MKQIPPALTSKSKFKDVLFAQGQIAEMIKKRTFQNVRQIIPHKEMSNTVDLLDLNKNKKKIMFLSLYKAIFYSLTVKNSSRSRSIASVGQRKLGEIFSGLPSVSHVAILDALNSYDEEKIDALISQITNGARMATNRVSQATDRVKIIDGTSLTFSYSRTKDDLPKSGSGGPGKSSNDSSKGLMKLGLVISPSNFIIENWQFTTDYDDNQIFRDLVDWSKKGYTWLIDRGNVALDYLQKFTDHSMYFIQKTWEKHTFDKLWTKKLPRTTKVLNRFDLREEQRGWLIRQKDGLEVKVRRIIAYDHKNDEMVSITTNDLESRNYVIIKRFAKRWDVEIVINWIKNTLGPNNTHKLTQWSRLTGFRNMMRIWFSIAALLCSFAQKSIGVDWWEPQRFSLGDVIREYEGRLSKWLEAKYEYRVRHKESKGVG